MNFIMRVLAICFINCLLVSSLAAQKYRTAAGIRIGTEFGLTVQQLVLENATLEGIIQKGFFNDLTTISVLYEHHQKMVFKGLNCLPSCLNTEFYYYDQRQTLKEWHQQTEEEANKYSDDKVCAQYYYLIYREFCKMCKAAGVDF